MRLQMTESAPVRSLERDGLLAERVKHCCGLHPDQIGRISWRTRGIWIGIILLTLLFLRSGQCWRVVVSMILLLVPLLGGNLL